MLLGNGMFKKQLASILGSSDAIPFFSESYTSWCGMQKNLSFPKTNIPSYVEIRRKTS